MPAYFSVTFELDKSPTAIKDFYTALLRSGLLLKGGYWECESDSFNDIIRWNQDKLDIDFELGCAEHYSNDFKQVCFDYYDFSEVRVYVMNKKGQSTFEFNMIIPEDDFIEHYQINEEYHIRHKAEKMELIKTLAKNIWQYANVLAIQTSWEFSDCPPQANQLSIDIKPQTEPFCIIKYSDFVEKIGLYFDRIDEDGVLIEDCSNWGYWSVR